MYGGGGSLDELMGASGSLAMVLPMGGLWLVREGKYGDEREIWWLEGFGEKEFILHCTALV